MSGGIRRPAASRTPVLFAGLLAALLLLAPGSRALGQEAGREEPPAASPAQSKPPETLPPQGKSADARGESAETKPEEKEPVLHTPLPPPEIPGTARPLPVALPENIRPFPALQLLAGTPQFSVHSGETDPGVTLDPGKGFAHGALWGVDWVGEYIRAGYFRLLYRHDLPAGTAVAGHTTNFVSFESDAFWTHGGFRPFDSLYAGLGLGVQQRRIRYELTDRAKERVVLETVVSGGVLLEYAVSQPFVLQIRYARDLPGARLETAGLLILFAYTVPL